MLRHSRIRDVLEDFQQRLNAPTVAKTALIHNPRALHLLVCVDLVLNIISHHCSHGVLCYGYMTRVAV